MSNQAESPRLGAPIDFDLAEDPYGCVNPFELIYPLFQRYRHCVAYIFADHLSNVCPYG